MKSKLKLLLIMLIGLLLYVPTHAQESLSFSLKEAQEYAKMNSYVVKNTGLDVTKARKKVWETIAMGLPQVNGTADYTKNISAAKSPMPVAIIPKEFWPYIGIPDDTPVDGTYPISFAQKYSSNWGFSVSQLIFDGSYIVGVGSSQIYLNMAKEVKEKTEIDVTNAVAQSYYLVLIAEENLKVMEENLSNSKKLFSDTKAMFQNGFVEEQDVEQMQLLVKSSENEILKAEREIRVSKMVLKYVMGVDVALNIELTDDLDKHLNPLKIKASYAEGFDYTSHVDFRMMNTQTKVAEKLMLLEKSTYLPRLSGFYNWSKSSFGDNANLYKSNVDWFKSSMIGLNLSVPIFSSGMKRSKVKQANLDLEKAQNNQKLAEQTLQKDFLSAVADLQNAVAQFSNDTDNKQLAKRIFEKTTIKYNSGIAGSTELAQNESQYIRAQGAYVASMMQLLTAKINLDKAIGKY